MDNARGIDLGMANYQIVGCASAVRGMTLADDERLANYLDSLLLSDAEAFKKTAAAAHLREPATARMNALLGRTVVRDWTADLWEMQF